MQRRLPDKLREAGGERGAGHRGIGGERAHPPILGRVLMDRGQRLPDLRVQRGTQPVRPRTPEDVSGMHEAPG
jgi:hypothetical protein